MTGDPDNAVHSAVIIGAGNVAFHLGNCLKEHGIAIRQVYNRTKTNGEPLALLLQAEFTDSAEKLDSGADLYLVAVSDDAIDSVVSQCRFSSNALLVHTAGAIDLNILSGKSSKTGVLYPLQTFSRGKKVNFNEIPFFIEANSPQALDALKKLASLITDHVYEASSAQRMHLHLAAVIASNFSNHLLALAEKILKAKGFEPGILKPLMNETIGKAFAISAGPAQTGPAVRGNQKVIQKHLELLKEFPEMEKVYKVLTESIMNSRE